MWKVINLWSYFLTHQNVFLISETMGCSRPHIFPTSSLAPRQPWACPSSTHANQEMESTTVHLLFMSEEKGNEQRTMQREFLGLFFLGGGAPSMA